MHAPQSRSTVLVAVVVVLAAGCLSGVSGEATPRSSPSPTGTITSTPTPAGHEAAMDRPDPDKEVRLRNEWNRSVEVRVRIQRDATNRTVHDVTERLQPGAERTAYDLSTADPDGVEAFTVVVTARNTTERVGIETNECYGNVYAEVSEDGTLYVYYAIC
jgi:FlaG/FlaF family flagellin (archaellin)